MSKKRPGKSKKPMLPGTTAPVKLAVTAPTLATPLLATSTQPPTTSTPQATSDTATQYEFTEIQNRVIDELAVAIIWVRLPLLIAAFLQALIATGLAFRLKLDGAHIVGVMGHAIAAFVCFLLAGWLQSAAIAFSRITTTAGRDLSHLMTALQSLTAWFDLLAFFVKLYLFLLALLVALLLVGLIAGAFQEPLPG